MSCKIWLVLGALLAGTSVLLGAYGSHGLEKRLQTELDQRPVLDQDPALSVVSQMKSYDIAVRYQMIHAFALMLVGIMAAVAPGRWWTVAGICFLLGEVIFSGGLYAQVSTWDKSWSTVVPYGGVAFVIGWLLFAGGSLLAKFSTPPA